jgi:hypothetical protein
MRLPGCREHVVVASVEPWQGGDRAPETRLQIADQNGVLPADLDRANPGRDWTTLQAGDRILIPTH